MKSLRPTLGFSLRTDNFQRVSVDRQTDQHTDTHTHQPFCNRRTSLTPSCLPLIDGERFQKESSGGAFWVSEWSDYSHEHMTKRKRTFYCNDEEPQYLLGSEKPWPLNGSLNCNTIVKLEPFCEEVGKNDKIPSVQQLHQDEKSPTVVALYRLFKGLKRSPRENLSHRKKRKGSRLKPRCSRPYVLLWPSGLSQPLQPLSQHIHSSHCSGAQEVIGLVPSP